MGPVSEEDEGGGGGRGGGSGCAQQVLREVTAGKLGKGLAGRAGQVEAGGSPAMATPSWAEPPTLERAVWENGVLVCSSPLKERVRDTVASTAVSTGAPPPEKLPDVLSWSCRCFGKARRQPRVKTVWEAVWHQQHRHGCVRNAMQAAALVAPRP